MRVLWCTFLIAWGAHLTAADWWRDVVFYEIFVRSFQDHDGDGIGDFRGMIERLDYLNDGDPDTGTDLGIGGIWLMPVMQSPSYHGYDTTDYFQLNPQYGTEAEFKAFLREAHRRGIRVIVDLMLNHISSQHPWFLSAQRDPQSPYRDWFIWTDDDPGFVGPWDEPVWHASGDEYYYGIFWSGMPDLNFEHQAVTAKILEVSRHWIDELGVDGFRLDAVRHLIEDGQVQSGTPETHAWLKAYARALDRLEPDLLTIGEIWDSTEAVLPYVTANEVDLAFEFQLAERIMQAVQSGRAEDLSSHVRLVTEVYPDHRFASFLTNHDQERVMSVFRGDVDKAKLAAAILLTLPGTPFVYYGEEIGMRGKKPDPDIRTPMHWDGGPQAGFTEGDKPWKAVRSDFAQFNVAQQLSDPDSLLSCYRSLIQLRNRETALTRGDLNLLKTSSPGVLAMLRRHGDRYLMLVSNLRGRDQAELEVFATLSNLPQGTRQVRSLWGGSFSDTIEITSEGGFKLLFPSLSARSSLIMAVEQSP